MSIQEMHDWLDVLIDKYSAPYFTDDEKDLFINRAMHEYIHQLISPNVKSPERSVSLENFPERTTQWFNAIYPILQFNEQAAVTTGVISWPVINALATSSGKILYLGSVRDDSGNDVPLSRNNSTGRANRNDFKQPTTEYKRYVLDDAGINILPSNITGVNFSLSFIREPVDVDLTLGTNCELPTITHNKVTAIAAELMGVTTEQEALSIINQITE